MSLTRRALYLLALAFQPFAVFMGFVLVARGPSAFAGVPPGPVAAATVGFLLISIICSLPPWWLLRMGRRPAAWKGALIPGSAVSLMLLGIFNYNQRIARIDVPPLTWLLTALLLFSLLAVPGGLIGARMAKRREP